MKYSACSTLLLSLSLSFSLFLFLFPVWWLLDDQEQESIIGHWKSNLAKLLSRSDFGGRWLYWTTTDPIPAGRNSRPAPENEKDLAFLVIPSIAHSVKRSFYLASLCTIKRKRRTSSRCICIYIIYIYIYIYTFYSLLDFPCFLRRSLKEMEKEEGNFWG